jgi:hypothetical protein
MRVDAGVNMRSGDNGGRSGEKAATAEYVADLCRDLARMARTERMDTLAYLLDMACLEAESVGQQYRPDKFGH